MPVSAAYRPRPVHPELGPSFYDPVRPAAFPEARLRFRNDRAAATIGLETLTDAEWIAHFARFEPLPGNLPEPLALRYHGHQFRNYNPDLGDGRGFLFAQMLETEAAGGRLLDLSTKGSGRTPWSRGGDGRLTLKGGLREVLATEMLEARGARTSRSFSLIETGEDLIRHDEPSPTRSAVLTRLSHSHLRIGAFQRFTALEERAALRAAVDYAIAHYFPEAADEADPVRALFTRVVAEVARMGAEWTMAGFVHGVINSDNVVLTGESFDYGPWRFLPRFEPEFTAAYFDHTGLYAFGRQVEALGWNLARLAECLLELTPAEALQKALDRLFPTAIRATARLTQARLGLRADDEDAIKRNALFFRAMRDSGAPFERAFFDLMGGADPERIAASPIAATYAEPVWAEALAALRAAEPALAPERLFAEPYARRAAPVDMLLEEVEALWAPIAERDDWSAVEAKIAEIRAAGAFYERLRAASSPESRSTL